MTAITVADICAFLEDAGRARRVVAATPEVAAETAATGVALDTGASPGDVAWSRSPSSWIAFRGALLLAPEPDVAIEDAYPARAGRVLVVCDNPRLAMAQVVARFFADLLADREPEFADPGTAAEVTRLGAWVMNARLGRGVLLGPHCTIGCFGMGYERDPDGRCVRFPQLGAVVVEDDVHIGAHATIQRGALGDTLIRRGARIGPHANVGHNVEIGEDVLIAGHAQVGGGAHVGRGAVIWQAAVIANGVMVGAGAVVGMSAAVRHNVPAGQVWAGNPARKIR
jgi:UDP-3-O-[3-hydroxymyristoyl] glucosamine N-acyltransferase